MHRAIGNAVLALSGAGFSLTQAAIRRFGRAGAVVTEAICAGLLIRDASLIAAGTPGRLRRGPATLLWLECVAAGLAVAAGLPATLDDAALVRATAPRPGARERFRRAAVGTLFGLHTVRFRIWLQPDRGRR